MPSIPNDTKAGDELTSSFLNRILSWMREHPKVVAPLCRASDGSIYLGANLQVIRDAYTTSIIHARTTNQMGSGTAKYVYPDEANVGHFRYTGEAEFTAWNNTGGDIASGAYGYVVKVGTRIRFIEADCSSTTSPGAPTAA